MVSAESINQIFRDLGDINIVRIVFVLVVAWLVLLIDQRVLPRIARKLPGRIRVYLLAMVPAVRLIVMVVAAYMVLRIVIRPTFENLVALFGFLGVGLGFALKDYASSLVAGTVSLYEAPYRPGDWITVDGTYGEVKSIKSRAVHIITPDDTIAVIPHNRIWNATVLNATGGSTKLQCVAGFYLDPSHDGATVRRRLRDVGLTSPYVQLRHPITVVAENTPLGTHYRIRAYPLDPRHQFTFVTDLTERGRNALASLGVCFVAAQAYPERNDAIG